MDATMMRYPLTTQMIVDRGRRLFADSRVSCFDGTAITHVSYAAIAERAARLAAALAALGIARGERVGSFCWNSRAHLEAYLAVPAAGRVLHTINVRLFPEQITYLIAHADDRAIIVDAELVDVLAPALAQTPGVAHLIVAGSGAWQPPAGFTGQVHRYDELLAAHPPLTDWPALDENLAAVVCYTSGTTGHPKGVVYSHRTIFLHSLASMAVDSFGVCNADRILMLPSMFHANAWGLPFSGWFAGSDLILPGPHVQPDRIMPLVDATRPTLTAAVPTILNDLLQRHAREPLDLSSFRAIIVGGSAVSRHLIETVRATWGVPVVQGWGMTETSPLCVLSHPPRDSAADDDSTWRAKSGRPVAGMNVRIVDDNGAPLPEDGETVGRLQLRGPWVTAGYHAQDAGQSPLSADGWLETGDVGTIDRLGYVQITDRTKDLIKSGGEWISSTDLESAIAAMPGVREVAVIAVPDPRWEERPLAIIVPEAGHTPDFAAMRAQLLQQLARFMAPEYWTSMPDLPRTSVGKVDKKRLRDMAGTDDLRYARIAGPAATEADQ